MIFTQLEDIPSIVTFCRKLRQSSLRSNLHCHGRAIQTKHPHTYSLGQSKQKQQLKKLQEQNNTFSYKPQKNYSGFWKLAQQYLATPIPSRRQTKYRHK